ncbi:hypothetical protein GCM10009721_20180 [Terrabacter tumescens]|uniref:Uncharacterized protein n=1 Tax=Terrabacter tumescens TaxID=60443 RepID=A0ABQ2HXV4_9MICO|nr:DUF4383 domain-containing protein [Terrabacter tumescens]GGM94003.1 hypothetical protein GCM10009721_20180 [Terrabacter tumescens]
MDEPGLGTLTPRTGLAVGLVVAKESAANVVPVNSADNGLHLLVGLGMVLLGVALSRGRHASVDEGSSSRSVGTSGRSAH